MAMANHHYSLSTPTFFLNGDTHIPDCTLSIKYLQASKTSAPLLFKSDPFLLHSGFLQPRLQGLVSG
jgi:hypothetical protein